MENRPLPLHTPHNGEMTYGSFAGTGSGYWGLVGHRHGCMSWGGGGGGGGRQREVERGR